MTTPATVDPLADMIAQDAAAKPAPSVDKLDQITKAAGQLIELTAKAAVVDAQAALISDEITRLTQTVLPGLMDEAQLKQLVLDDGTPLKREDDVYASISKDNANAAADWLIANGYGSIVKMGFNIAVDKGDTKLQAKIRKLLTKECIGYEELSSVHSGTLRSFAKESVEAGRKLPPVIKVHIQPTVKVGKKKVSKEEAERRFGQPHFGH